MSWKGSDTNQYNIPSLSCRTEQKGVFSSLIFLHVCHNAGVVCMYRSLSKRGPWAEYLTSLPKRGVGVLSTLSAFNHERAPMSCLQRLKALEANNWTQNNVQWNHQWLRS